MTEKENILGRIREALKVPAPMPGHEHVNPDVPLATAVAMQHSPPWQEARQWLPVVGETFEERLALFRKNAAELKADFFLANNLEEVWKLLLEMRETGKWKKAGAHGGELTDAACRALALPICRTDQQYNVSELESCDVGITECDALVAQTGSVLLTGRNAGGRALSVLPPHPGVLAGREGLWAGPSGAFSFVNRKKTSKCQTLFLFIS